MKNLPLKEVELPTENNDSLTGLLRTGAQKLIAQAVEAELSILLEEHSSLRLEDGRQAVVRNGYLPSRTIQTGIGDVPVQVPKIRDRSGNGIKFTSSLLPPYLKRTKSVEELLPWLYLRGISTGDFQEALSSLLGKKVSGVSAATISRLKAERVKEHESWYHRDISTKKYVYWWADGIYSHVRMDNKLCLLVIIGVTQHGREDLLAFYDFPAEHWQSIRTTNPIESTFATVRLRSKRTRNCGSRATTLAMVFKLLQVAEKRWRKLPGFRTLELVVSGKKFKDGLPIEDQSAKNAA